MSDGHGCTVLIGARGFEPKSSGTGSLRRMLDEAHHDRDIAHQARRNWLDTIDAVTDALMVHDAQLRVVRCNSAYAARAGMSFAEVIGRPYWECFPRRPGPLELSPAAAPGTEFRIATGEAFVTRAFIIGHGETQETLHLFEDVTERRRREAQARAMQAVAASPFIFRGEVELAARRITEAAAQATGVARANVWLFNDAADELRCIDLFEAATGQHSSGMILCEQQFANEFRALKVAPYVDANDPLTDPRTAGYVEGYLKPLGITSMLDTVIEIEGRYLGLLCLEHVGLAHRWEADEIAFARRLADKVSETLSYRRSREAEGAMRASEERFRTLFEQAPVGITEVSPTGRYLKANPRLCEIMGYTEAELLQRTFRELTHPDDVDRDELNLARLTRSEISRYSTEKRYVRKDGKVVWATLVVAPVRNANGAVEYLVTIVEDITARKAAEQAFRDSEEKYRALFASSKDAFMTLSPPDWKFTSGNPAALAMFGARDADELVSRDPAGLSPERQPDGALSADKAREMIAIALREGNHFFDWTHRRMDGTEFPATVLLTSLPVQGQTLLNACVRDMTELRQAHAAVERRERFFYKVLEGGSDAHYVVDRNAKLLYRSESARRLTGYETSEVSGKDLTRFLTPESVAAASEGVAKVLSRPDEPSSAELRLTRRDGSVIEVEAVGRNLLNDPDVQGIVVTARDITQRKAGERALRESEERLRAIFAGSVDGIAAFDPQSRAISFANASMERLLGYGAGELDGLALERLLPAAESARILIEFDRGALGQSNGVADIPLQTRSGGAIYVDISGSMVSIGGRDYLLGAFRDATARRAATAQIRASLEGAIGAIGATMEARDPYTAGHQHRVGSLGAAIAQEMGLSSHVIEGIQFGGVIHDVGKIQVPAEILSKPTRLTRLELELVKVHPQAGYDIIKGIEFPWPIAQMVLQHHERLDGSGYPQGLKGEQIILEAKVLAVADVVEAMSSHRPYRPALGIDKALKEIEDRKGVWYDPAAVDACLRLFREKGFKL